MLERKMRKSQHHRKRGDSCHFPKVIPAWLRHLLTGVALCCCLAVMANGQNPLQPQDRSSPRAMLETFLEAGDAVDSLMAREYQAIPDMPQPLLDVPRAAIGHLANVAPATHDIRPH
jgi:hypothetical protein